MTDSLGVGSPEPRHGHQTRRSRRDAREVGQVEPSAIRQQHKRTIIAVAASLGLLALALWLVLPPVLGLFDDAPADFPGPGEGTVLIEIPSGSTGYTMGSILTEAGVVASQEAFILAFNADPNATSIHAGFYNLQLRMPAAAAVAALQDNANRADISVTVPDGIRASTVYERISTALGVDLEAVKTAAADTASYGLPAEAGGNPEGWFGAQTYILPPNVDTTTVLQLMVAETVGTLERLAIPREQWQETLIKASIAQREGTPQDFGKVVRVIINRSDPSNRETVGMLGMDSVALYGLGVDGVLLTNEQKEIDTPYNVFMHAGLPPTPIATPSVAAIEATVDPPEGTWNYFVTVNLDTGETKFATTYAEFLVYVEEYRQWLRDNPDSNPGNAETTTPSPSP